MKLTQRHIIKGYQEFELIDDYVRVRSKAPFKDAVELTVMLTILNPEPVISKSYLSFTSRVNGEALLSLRLGKPDTDAFNSFVNTLKHRAREEYQNFAGLKSVTQPAVLGANVYDEPPAFDDDGKEMPPTFRSDLDSERIDEAIRMLKTYLDPEDVGPLVTALEALRSDPRDATFQLRVVSAFNDLGSTQGAVLTYAPYVGILLSDGPAGAPY